MSWNEMLYAYQKEKGGVFMGSRAADWDGELVLSYRDEPLIIRTVGESNGRYTTTSIRVRLAIHLERDYELPASTRCWASWTGDWRSCPPDRTSTRTMAARR